jgi:hypothetical protein
MREGAGYTVVATRLTSVGTITTSTSQAPARIVPFVAELPPPRTLTSTASANQNTL